jgi:hypothetical protein
MTIFQLLLVLLVKLVHIGNGSNISTISHDQCPCALDFFKQMWRLIPVGETQLKKIMEEELPGRIPIGRHYPTKEEIKKILYHTLESPYTNVSDVSDIRDDDYRSYAQKLAPYLQGMIILKLGGPPKVMIEVGSFVGSGAIFAWAPIVQADDNDGVVICIDTWLGDVNMRLGSRFQEFLNNSDGHPQVYPKFLRRIKSHGLQETIFPFPISSLVGARTIALTQWIIDVVYIDSAHEIGETFAELVLYFQLLRPGGVMMGDDYGTFPAVKHDVDLFANYFRPEILTFELMSDNDSNIANEWVIVKL